MNIPLLSFYSNKIKRTNRFNLLNKDFYGFTLGLQATLLFDRIVNKINDK